VPCEHPSQYIFLTKDLRQFHGDTSAMKTIADLADILMLSEQSFSNAGWSKEAKKIRDCSICLIDLLDRLQRQQLNKLRSFSIPQTNRRRL
jgi:hypothetical protein